jgi:gentisate 1,2-dioxygenase
LVPLWESPTAHKPPPPPVAATLWPWSAVRPLAEKAMRVTSPEAVERRVLSLVSPHARMPEDESTTRNLAAAIQILLPGETARPHRHSMNALRFVLEGGGAFTMVNGKPCLMEEGDLILTPAWTWHEHAHRGDRPIIWLDTLDVPLHLYLGTARFQPGPAGEMPATIADDAFSSAHVLPDVDLAGAAHSPVFRYPYPVAAAAVAKAPRARDGSRRVRYVNPATGGPAMALLDCCLVELDGAPTVPFRTTANAICAVVEGAGTSRIGERTIEWRAKDIFTLPQNNWIVHEAAGAKARLFIASDRDVLARLCLLEEEFGNGR